MAIKSSNVTARVEPEIKEEAEAILAQLGISASSGINMFLQADHSMARSSVSPVRSCQPPIFIGRDDQ